MLAIRTTARVHDSIVVRLMEESWIGMRLLESLFIQETENTLTNVGPQSFILKD
jgi:hypothetical protein